MGLMGAYSTINEVLDMIDLDALGLEYESYLQSMGRQLFYMVAASYITSYLAIIFLVVSNTIIGVQFLMNQQRTGRRYQTLVRLGATYHALCGSARKQITWFMGLPIIVAAISYFFHNNPPSSYSSLCGCISVSKYLSLERFITVI